MADDLYLYLTEPERSGTNVIGRLLLHELSQSSTTGTLKLDLEFLQDDNHRLFAGIDVPPPHWVQLAATLSTTQLPIHTVGTMEIGPDELPAFRPVPPSSRTRVSWLWRVSSEDIERIENSRSHQGDGPLQFTLSVGGVIQLNDGVYGFAGKGHPRVATSQWEMLLKSLGYTLGPTKLAVLTGDGRESPTWEEAEQRLEAARRHVRIGEGYAALASCLGEFEKLVSAPYSWKNWVPNLEGPDQKRESIAQSLGGFCTYLNRVGHHKERSVRDDSGELPPMPLDHWEADLAVGTAHFLLALALRSRT